jgi:protein required for attachment to host cells
MRLPRGIVILLADGSRMLPARNHGDPARSDLCVTGRRQMETPPNRELLSGAPGLGFAYGYPGRDTFSKSGPYHANEARFLTGAAEALAQAADAANGLTVVAPPEALGELRRHCDAGTRKTLGAEVDRNLGSIPLTRLPACVALTR